MSREDGSLPIRVNFVALADKVACEECVVGFHARAFRKTTVALRIADSAFPPGLSNRYCPSSGSGSRRRDRGRLWSQPTVPSISVGRLPIQTEASNSNPCVFAPLRLRVKKFSPSWAIADLQRTPEIFNAKVQGRKGKQKRSSCETYLLVSAASKS